MAPHCESQPEAGSDMYCSSVRNDMLSGTDTENNSGWHEGRIIAPKPPIE